MDARPANCGPPNTTPAGSVTAKRPGGPGPTPSPGGMCRKGCTTDDWGGEKPNAACGPWPSSRPTAWILGTACEKFGKSAGGAFAGGDQWAAGNAAGSAVEPFLESKSTPPSKSPPVAPPLTTVDPSSASSQTRCMPGCVRVPWPMPRCSDGSTQAPRKACCGCGAAGCAKGFRLPEGRRLGPPPNSPTVRSCSNTLLSSIVLPFQTTIGPFACPSTATSWKCRIRFSSPCMWAGETSLATPPPPPRKV
mmetsp:Transcript_1137/g.4727  ORF Transcript_1137/g.4727 Transcript_1137/m.4727 type:complete len:249 (+) Transcript_1137:219-965(+)